MYQGKSFLGIIPARGGSKGVPRKNIRPLAGKPLIAWTIEQAKASRYLDRTIVSTEDEEIASVAKAYGGDVPFLRPEELARDDSPSIDFVLHAMEQFPVYDAIVLLQCTSPLRATEDVDGCIEMFCSQGVESCVTVTEAEHSPYWMYTLGDDGAMKPLIEIDRRESYQRQKLPAVYQLNGAVYVCSYDFLKREKVFVSKDTCAYVMPRKRSYDIDTMMDFTFVDLLLREQANG